MFFYAGLLSAPVDYFCKLYRIAFILAAVKIKIHIDTACKFVLLLMLILTSCKEKKNGLQEKMDAGKPYVALGKSNTEGDFKRSLFILDSVYRTIKNPNAWDKEFYHYAACWMNETLDRYDLAIKHADSCIVAIDQIENKEIAAAEYSGVLLEKGLINVKLGNYNDAYKNFFDAKQAINLLKDSCSKQNPLDYLGLVLYRQKEYELAKNAFAEELTLIDKCIAKSSDAYGKKQNILDNIGLCYTRLNKPDSAKLYYYAAINAVEESKSPSFNEDKIQQIRYNANIGVISGNLAKTYINSNPDSAILLYKKAIALNANGTSELGDAQLCMYQLANVQLNQRLYKDVNITLNSLKLSLDTFKNQSAELGYKQVLYSYYAATNQYEQAFKAHKNYLILKDSLSKSETGINTTNINKELRDREQQLQIQLLQRDQSISNLYLWIIAAALLLAAVIALLVYRNYHRSKKRNIQLTQLNEEITVQQKLTEDALKQLGISNKEKDRILNVVAHDLRNPIGAIANFLDIVQIKYEHSDDEEKILKSSQQAAVHSLTLINELLEVNELNNGRLALNKVKVDLLSIVHTTVEQLQFKASKKQQQLSISTAESSIQLNADAEKLQRVLTNLIDNAIKFSAVSKTISIIIHQSNKEATVQVKDAGIGIPADMKEQLFTASITVKRKGTNNEKSNGLGLSICKQIIEAHDGVIWVESGEGTGSSFFIKLPVEV